MVLLTSCVRSSDGEPPPPLGGDLQDAVGTWFDERGAPLPEGQPFVMDVWRGPTHCAWEDLLFLAISWPLGTEVPGPFMGSPRTHMFVRLSTTNDLEASDFATTFDPSAELPTDAYDTGYSRKSWHLWVSENRIKRAVWLVHGDTVERWPAAKHIFGCM